MALVRMTRRGSRENGAPLGRFLAKLVPLMENIQQVGRAIFAHG